MAIEIKRTQAGAGYLNRPIGVVNVKTGSEQIAQQQADLFKTASNIAFQFADISQKKKAKEAAIEVLVTDENGMKSYQPISGFGRSNELANDIYNKRYASALELDASQFANQLHAQKVTPEVFSELYNSYVGDTLKNIKESGGEEFASLYADGLYRIGDGHVNKLVSDQIAASERQATSNYLSRFETTAGSLNNLRGDALDAAYNNARQDLNDNGIDVYNLAPGSINDLQNRLSDNYSNGLLNEEGKDVSNSLLLKIQDPARWDDPDVKKAFPKLIKHLKKLPDDRLNSFNTKASTLYTDRQALLKTEYTREQVRQDYRLGMTDGNDASVREAVDLELNYTSELDALAPSITQASIEDNAAHPGNYLTNISERAVEAGLYNVDQIVPWVKRLSNIKAAQVLSGRTLSQYFGGGTKGEKIQALHTYLSGVGRTGDSKIVDAYTRRSSVDRETLMQTMVDNAEYPLEVGETPSAKKIARHYLMSNSKFEDIPLALREDMIAQTEYLLGFPDANNVANALYDLNVVNYLPSAFYEKSRQNSSYSMYGYSPEKYLSEQGVKNLQADLGAMSQDGESIFLKPILSSDISAKYVAYTLDKKGGQVFKSDSNGNPIVINTQAYRIAGEVIQKARAREIDLLRSQALEKPFGSLATLGGQLAW